MVVGSGSNQFWKIDGETANLIHSKQSMVEQNKIKWIIGGEELVWSPQKDKSQSVPCVAPRVSVEEAIPRRVQTTLRPRMREQCPSPDETTTYETFFEGVHWILMAVRALFDEAED